jgi:hypothetical protein
MSKWAHEKAIKKPAKEEHLYCVSYTSGCHAYRLKNDTDQEWMPLREAKQLQKRIGMSSEIHRFGDPKNQ